MRIQIFTFLLMGLFVPSVSAIEPVIDGVTYQLLDGRAYISDGKACSGLYEVPSHIKHEGTEYEVAGILGSSFKDNKNITGLVIPETFRRIDLTAFIGCDNLKEFHIEDLAAWCQMSIGVSTLGIDPPKITLCMNGEEIRDIAIPKDVSVIRSRVFEGSLWENDFTSVTFPEGLATIESFAFSGCSGFKAIHLPNTVTAIGEYAFAYCLNLGSIALPDCLDVLEEGILSGDESLEEIKLPTGITRIGSYALGRCAKLKELTIPDNVESIGNSAIAGCGSLETLKFGSHVKTIEDGAFYGCQALKEVKLSEGLETVGTDAFRECCALETVILPSTIRTIGSGAFLGREQMSTKEVYCYAADIPEQKGYDYVFMPYPYVDATLYVPQASVEKYKAAPYWKDFARIEAIENGPSGMEDVHGASQGSVVAKNKDIYDLQGRRLEKAPEKGLYIENGKKTLR